jgi:predicted CXXCH cytochrome family protein
MRRIFGLTVGLLLVCGLASAQSIVGTAHDFTDTGWTGEICLPCHTPHNAYNFAPAPDGTNELVPLWNHTQTTSNFTVYSSPSGTLNATDLTQPAGVSRACLSCHDGTVALDSFGGATGGTTIDGEANLGFDLSNDHPVSFTYDNALAGADGELHPPGTTNSGLGGTIANDMLFNNQMECGSCHDVHGTPGLPAFLIKTNAGSALCLTCHNK